MRTEFFNVEFMITSEVTPTDGASLSTAAYVAQYYALNVTRGRFNGGGPPYGDANLVGFYEGLSDRLTLPEGEDSMEVCYED